MLSNTQKNTRILCKNRLKIKQIVELGQKCQMDMFFIRFSFLKTA